MGNARMTYIVKRREYLFTISNTFETESQNMNSDIKIWWMDGDISLRGSKSFQMIPYLVWATIIRSNLHHEKLQLCLY